MTIAFFSNFINHHQVHLSDELYRIAEGNYYFIENKQMPESFHKTGYPDYTSRPYVIQAWKNIELYKKSLNLAKTVDVALFDGSDSLVYEITRYKSDRKLLSFEISERWCKRGIINYLSPRFLKWYIQYLIKFRYCNVRKLCCSAYLPNDMYKVGAFKGKCYKWAYLTKTDTINIDKIIESRPKDIIRIMWCARFIDWKHPEFVVEAAKTLKEQRYNFIINMYGGGDMVEKIRRFINDNNLHDVVNLKGNVPNDEIHNEMRKHHIFLFTSDRNEGWGAVANEALSNGCAVVGDECIGSIPFLVEHGKNGRIYKTQNIDSLIQQLSYYFDHKESLDSNCRMAYRTMVDIWTPLTAANNLMVLINSLLNGSDNPIKDGPCSKAYPIKK